MPWKLNQATNIYFWYGWLPSFAVTHRFYSLFFQSPASLLMDLMALGGSHRLTFWLNQNYEYDLQQMWFNQTGMWSLKYWIIIFFCGTVDLSTSNNLQQIFFLMVDYWCLWVYGRSFHAYNNYRSTIRFVPLNHLRRWSFWWSLHHLEMYLCCDFGGVELLLLETWRSQVKLLGLFIVSDSENPWKTSGELYLTCFFSDFTV